MNVLLTSVGRRSYLVQYFKEALGAGLVYVANSSSQTPAFLVADGAVVTPLIYDESYIPFLLDYCVEKKIDFVVSLFDIDLPILSANREAFEKIGVRVVVSEPEVIDICNDKWRTYCFLKENDLAAPATFLEISKAKAALDTGEISWPLIVKPRWGMGSLGVYEAENEEELEVFFRKTWKSIQSSYLKYEANADLDHCVLIQEKLKGQEHGLDVMNDLEGRYQNTSVKIKYAMRSGETDCAITIDEPVLRALGEKLSYLLHHIGNLDVDVFMVDGKPYVLEMNARFGGGYPFSHVAGVNLPAAIVAWMRGEMVKPEWLEPRMGVCSHKDITMSELKR